MADFNSFSDYFSLFTLNKTDHKHLKLLTFLGILQVLRYECRKFLIFVIIEL